MNKMFLHRAAVGAALAGLGILAPACSLDRQPFTEISSAVVYTDFANYKPLLAKLYAGLATSGQKGPDGNVDITGIDEGFGQYLRAYWTQEELPTDEALIAWDDQTIKNYHAMAWSPSDVFNRAMFSRIYYQISACNEFLRRTGDGDLSKNGITGDQAAQVRTFRSEARFLRALSYWHALDFYGNVPFVTENDEVSAAFKPRQASRAEVFNYVESELKAIADDGGTAATQLLAPRTNEYARADKAAAWTLLAKLYLNAEVYLGAGNGKYTECITYCNKVFRAGYALNSSGGLPANTNTAYRNLFRADNHSSPEFIFPIAFDGIRTKGYGGTTYLVNASIGGAMRPAAFGVPNGGWAGLRTTSALVNLFPDTTQACPDRRFLFYTKGQTLNIVNVGGFASGFAFKKWTNKTSNGVDGSDPEGKFPDTDFPMFRLGDVNLMYAEAVLRNGSGGDRATALAKINDLRERAYNVRPGTVNQAGNITDSDLTLPFIMDERARELFAEGHRRTDLIRFSKFVSGYTWPWKGGVAAGRDADAYRVLYPIPTADLNSNPTLVQNQGY